MEDVSVSHAKEHLEELIARAARGEDVRISDPRLGSVRLLPAEGAGGKSVKVVFGQWKARLNEIPEDRLLAPLSGHELSWMSGEESPGGL